MSQQQPDQALWSAVDDYLSDLLLPADAGLEGALAASAAAGLPGINVSANQGRFLHLLARMIGARRILEIGTLGGYSTIWLARALPADGRLITLERDARTASVARANIAEAGLAEVVEVRVGSALDWLPRLVEEAAGPFDLTFIDADKPNTIAYFDFALRLSRPGSLIIVDNVVREGQVIDAGSGSATVQAVRRFLEHLANQPRVSPVALQTVGSKGYDGLAIALVEGERG